MFSARHRGPRSFRAFAVAIALCSILLAPTGIGRAQEASGDVEISISVRPSSVTPVPTTTPKPGEMPTSATPALPGTVSSQLVLLTQPSGTGDAPAIAFIVVRDDRGAAAGWEVTLASAGGNGALPELVVNKDATIMRVLPGDGLLSDQVQGINGGRTLGQLAELLPILHAANGSGSGLFLQQLVVLVPGTETKTIDGTICV